MIIGLSGYSGSGKDTAADVLVEQCGFVKVAFADKLRSALYTLNPIVVADQEHHGMLPVNYSGPVYRRLSSIIDEYGWDGYKKSPFSNEIRKLIQTFGTDIGRDMIGENVWVNATLESLPESGDIVITDIRFENEMNAVLSMPNSTVWRVVRPGSGPVNNHVSETSLDTKHFEVVLYNDGDIEEFRNNVYRTYLACEF